MSSKSYLPIKVLLKSHFHETFLITSASTMQPFQRIFSRCPSEPSTLAPNCTHPIFSLISYRFIRSSLLNERERGRKEKVEVIRILSKLVTVDFVRPDSTPPFSKKYFYSAHNHEIKR